VSAVLILSLIIGPSQSHYEKNYASQRIVLNYDFHEDAFNWEYIFDAFTFHRRFDTNGNRIILVHMPVDSIEFDLFVEDFLLLGVNYYKRMLNKEESRGNARIKYVNSFDEVIRYVASIPGSIGYVDKFLYINNGTCCSVKVIDLYDYSEY